MRHPLRAAMLCIAASLAVGACADAPPSSTELSARGISAGPHRGISDASRGGNPRFHWLAPMVTSTRYSGTFEGGLSPQVLICELAGNACTRTLATFGAGTSPAVVLDAANEQYRVNWDTRAAGLDVNKLYRVQVLLGGVVLGYADVDPVTTGTGLKSADSDNYIPLIDGRTLPIKFRIERSRLAGVLVQAISQLTAGQAWQARADGVDGTGSVLPGLLTGISIVWWSDNPSVATVGASGVVTAVSPGTTTIWASAGGFSNGAPVNVAGPSLNCAVGVLCATGEPVRIIFRSGNTGGYTSDLYCQSLTGSPQYIGTGYVTPSGQTWTVDGWARGEEVLCWIYVRNTGDTFYSGPQERNPDGLVHATLTGLEDYFDGSVFTGVRIGFEEVFGGGDLDFDDIGVEITGGVHYRPAP
jgi:hypothetical protein